MIKNLDNTPGNARKDNIYLVSVVFCVVNGELKR